MREWSSAGRLAAAVALGLVGATGITAGLRWNSPDPADSPYTLARVTRGDVVQSVLSSGQLRPASSVEISSQISGLVTEVLVDFNSTVRAGDVLARIDEASYVQRLRQAEADLEAAEAEHALVAENLKRMAALKAADLITAQEYDAVDAQLRRTRAALMTGRAAVESARVDLQRCTITSPIDGVVIFKQIEVGKTVVSSFSAPTLFIVAKDLSHLRIVAPIADVDVPLLRPGQEVQFTVDAIPGRTFTASLTQIRNSYVPQEKAFSATATLPTTTFEAAIDVENRDGTLRPGLKTLVSIIVAHRPNALLIPNAALRFSDVSGDTTQNTNQNVATVLKVDPASREANPERVRIETGITDGIVTEVITGLTEGDRVVTGIRSDAERTHRTAWF